MIAGGRELDFSGTDRFTIVRRLGQGGMGVVYEAFDRDVRGPVALKTLRNMDAQALYRLKREFRTLQDLQHPNLISLGELIERDGQWFFTMELIEGVDFLTWVRGETDAAPEDAAASAWAPTEEGEPASLSAPPERRGACDEGRLRAALAQLARGLVALHDAGTIHRDIKPSNILVESSGRLVLLDFGLAAPASSGGDSSTEGKVVGTAAYMAPEQALANQCGPETDWYGLGVVLYQALTGAVPFDGRTPLELLMNKQQSPPRDPRERAPETPADLAALCMELLAVDPRQRPAGAQVLGRLGIEDPAPVEPIRQSISGRHPGSRAPFVGRAEELERLRGALDDARRGNCRSVLVRGESGIGKSALLRRFVEDTTARIDDLVVLAGRCYERESVPYKAFDGVVDALTKYLRRLPLDSAASLLPGHAALLRRVFPTLGGVEAIARVPQPRADVQNPHELRTRVFDALRELLRRLAERHPLIILIDDLQWADADSRLLLEDVLRAPDAPPLLLLGSARTTGTAPGDDVLPGDHDTIALAPLDDDTARRLAGLLLDRNQAAAVANPASIATEARGHPLYIDELVRHATIAPRNEARPLLLDDAIRERVRQLAVDARTLLEFVAIAEAPLSRGVLAAAARMDAQEMGKHLDLLQLANLIRSSGRRSADRVEAYHDRVREAVQTMLPPPARVHHHERLALALEIVPGTAPELVLRHLAAAGESAKAAAYAKKAARRASEALAFDRAAELYRSALRLGHHDDADGRGLRLALGESLARAGRGAEAAEAFLAAVPGADPNTRLECQRKAAEQLLICGHIERGLEAIRAVLGEIGVSLPATPRRALRSLLWAQIKLRARGLRWTERHESEIPPAAFTRLEIYRAVSFGLTLVDAIRGMDFISRGTLLALRTGEPRRVGVALAYEACALASQGKRRRARRFLDDAHAVADRTHDPYLGAWMRIAEGFLHYFGGNFHSAARWLHEAETALREHAVGPTFELNNVRLFRLLSLRHLGSLVELKARCDEYVRDAVRRGDRYAATSLRRGVALPWLADDRPDLGRADLERAGWIAPEGTFHVQHWYALEARAELALYEDRALEDEAQLAESFARLEASLLNRVQIIRTIGRSLRGRLALARLGRSEARTSELRIAGRMARKLDREGVGYARLYAGLLRAAVDYQSGELDAARSHLRRTIDVATENAMSLHTACARRRLGQLLGGAEGDALVAEADAWMSAQGVARADRFVEVIAPGFGDRRPG